ncbi:MAG: formylglycine-generating enzyme family protein [Thermodesulfobacteriota bacterium]|nr:formylglycine-generating enzyme family protein [Thermodesulfobacteriota bacterium]
MTETITNSIGMELVLIPAGSFRMGGDKKLEQAEDHETPRHIVKISKTFYMGKYEVTQSQWSEIMNNNPSEFKDDIRPVERVSWNDVQEFIHKLNNKEETNKYRLPTEAEWEYAARADTESAYCFSSDIKVLSQYAWYRINSAGKTHPIGQLKPNAWGLYDVHGNVHEWCQDWFDRNYYSQSPSNSPLGPSSGLAKVSRGGDWGNEDWYCRSASRSLSSPDRRSNRLGFRLVSMV